MIVVTLYFSAMLRTAPRAQFSLGSKTRWRSISDVCCGGAQCFRIAVIGGRNSLGRARFYAGIAANALMLIDEKGVVVEG